MVLLKMKGAAPPATKMPFSRFPKIWQPLIEPRVALPVKATPLSGPS